MTHPFTFDLPEGYTVTSEDGSSLPAELTLSAGLVHADDLSLAAERIARWGLPRAHWAPRVTVLRDSAGTAVAAALTASRPYTASRKIVDVVVAGRGDATLFRAIVGAAAADAPALSTERPKPALVRFEEHPRLAPLGDAERAALQELGFTAEPTPVPSVPSTRVDAPEGVRAWSRWADGMAPSRVAPYYGQTTDVTCGAVTALMALESAGLDRFSNEDGAANHTWELDFWRRATNLPACEPIGLAVTTANAITDAGLPLALPRVVLSVDGPVLVEDFGEEWDRSFRSDLQAESLRQANLLGLTVERRWAETSEIYELVEAGNDVFLLIDLEPLIGDATPHWVLAHDVVGEDALLVSDPWVEATEGETWVDTSAQPITLDGVDLITRWGNPAYRGIIILPRSFQ